MQSANTPVSPDRRHRRPTPRIATSLERLGLDPATLPQLAAVFGPTRSADPVLFRTLATGYGLAGLAAVLALVLGLGWVEALFIGWVGGAVATMGSAVAITLRLEQLEARATARRRTDHALWDEDLAEERARIAAEMEAFAREQASSRSGAA